MTRKMTVSKKDLSTITELMCKTIMNDQGNHISYHLTKSAVRGSLARGVAPVIRVSNEYIPIRELVGGQNKTVRGPVMQNNVKDMSLIFNDNGSVEEFKTAIPVETLNLLRSTVRVFLDEKLYTEKKNGMWFHREIMDMMVKVYRQAIQGQVKLILSVREFDVDTSYFPRSQTEGVVMYGITSISIMDEELRTRGLID